MGHTVSTLTGGHTWQKSYEVLRKHPSYRYHPALARLAGVQDLVAKDQTSTDLSLRLQGQALKVPNLLPLFPGHWPNKLNPHYERLALRVKEQLSSHIADGHKLQKAEAADFALFAASWWPRAAWPRLYVMAWFAIWAFLWDDEVDMTSGDVSMNFRAAEVYRRDTVAYLRHCLGLGPCPTHVPKEAASFEIVGDAVRAECGKAETKLFLKELEYFLEMSQVEQKYRLDGVALTLDGYWSIRLGTSAVFPFLVLSCFCNEVRLPDYILKDEDTKILWDEANINISIVNDIFSLKKEMRGGSLINVIPMALSHDKHLPCQRALDIAIENLEVSIKRMDAAAERLVEKHTHSPETEKHIRDFVKVAMENCTGNLSWSLRTQRYGHALMNNGTVTMKL